MKRFFKSMGLGLVIGLVNLIWLYAAYYLGWHTSGTKVFVYFMLVWVALNAFMYPAILRHLRNTSENWSYLRGLGLALVAAAASAGMAIIAQIGYWEKVNPDFGQYMLEQTREHFASQGQTEAEISAKLELAKEQFTLKTYAMQSAIMAFALGFTLSAFSMIFIRRNAGVKSTSPTHRVDHSQNAQSQKPGPGNQETVSDNQTDTLDEEHQPQTLSIDNTRNRPILQAFKVKFGWRIVSPSSEIEELIALDEENIEKVNGLGVEWEAESEMQTKDIRYAHKWLYRNEKKITDILAEHFFNHLQIHINDFKWPDDSPVDTSDPDCVYALCRLTYVSIIDRQMWEDNSPAFLLEFSCMWGIEHGLAILFKGLDIIETGGVGNYLAKASWLEKHLSRELPETYTELDEYTPPPPPPLALDAGIPKHIEKQWQHILNSETRTQFHHLYQHIKIMGLSATKAAIHLELEIAKYLNGSEHSEDQLERLDEASHQLKRILPAVSNHTDYLNELLSLAERQNQTDQLKQIDIDID